MHYCIDVYIDCSSILGLKTGDADELKAALLKAASETDCLENEKDEFGQRYQIDFIFSRQERSAVIRSFWIIKIGEQFPRFVSCFVKGEIYD